MTDNKSLDDFFSADAAPDNEARNRPVASPDPMFRMAVMEQVAQRRFVRKIAIEIASVALMALCLFVLSPTIGVSLVEAGQNLTQVAAVLTMVGAVIFAARYAATHPLHLRFPQWMR